MRDVPTFVSVIARGVPSVSAKLVGDAESETIGRGRGAAFVAAAASTATATMDAAPALTGRSP
jgi:hypothetical protein